MTVYSQCRLAKEIDFNGKITTFPELGRLYISGEKTLKGSYLKPASILKRAFLLIND
jgi:hypothetical protein